MKIIVIGAPCGGTSMVTRLLEKCGMYLGKSRGSENIEFRRINELILKQNSFNWRIPIPKVLKLSSKIEKQMRNFSLSFDQKHPVGWKSPRATFTFHLWAKALAPEEVHVIWVIRPWQETAISIEKLQKGVPDGMKMARNLTQCVIRNLRGQNWMGTYYPNYFINWRQELEKITKFLGLKIPADDSIIENYIDEKLYHERIIE